ncbi:MAG: hypothetical protein VXY56_08695 [Pseudomonadota bacterium]|nr:hypothetical protein [Pseudomonadota bacterium]
MKFLVLLVSVVVITQLATYVKAKQCQDFNEAMRLLNNIKMNMNCENEIVNSAPESNRKLAGSQISDGRQSGARHLHKTRGLPGKRGATGAKGQKVIDLVTKEF